MLSLTMAYKNKKKKKNYLWPKAAVAGKIKSEN